MLDLHFRNLQLGETVFSRTKFISLSALRIIRGVISPTRAIAEHFKRRESVAAANFIRGWNLTFLILAIVALFALMVINPSSGRMTSYAYDYLWLIPFSRINEIFYAFYFDGLDRLKGKSQGTALSAYQRIVLVSQCYVEVIINFCIIYYVGFYTDFSKSFRDIIEAFYFSVTSITTVGFGDIAPTGRISQLLVIYEIITGLVLILVALGTYIDRAGVKEGSLGNRVRKDLPRQRSPAVHPRISRRK